MWFFLIGGLENILFCNTSTSQIRRHWSPHSFFLSASKVGQGRFTAPSVQVEKLTWGYESAGCSLGQQAPLLACFLLWASAPLSCGSVCGVGGGGCVACFVLAYFIIKLCRSSYTHFYQVEIEDRDLDKSHWGLESLKLSLEPSDSVQKPSTSSKVHMKN